MVSGADGIVEALRRNEVSVVYGIPSVHNIRLYESLRKNPTIQHVLCRHETTAVHMADGFARARNQLGVVIASTGPGTGYMVPAIQEAWGSCSPVLLITTNIPTSKIGKGLGVLHELENQKSLFSTITKATILIRSEDDIQDLTQEAIHIALSGRPGPVYLEVPFDLLDKKISGKSEREPKKEEELVIPFDIEKAVSILRASKQPILIAGKEAIRVGASADVLALAEVLVAPVITTSNAKGIISEDHFLSIGNVARRGVVREIVQYCDVALAIGTRLREVDAKRRGLSLYRLIHIDWDGRWIDKNFPSEVALTGDIRLIIKTLLEKLKPAPSSKERLNWIKEMRNKLEEEVKEIRRAHVELEYLDVIRKLLPRESTLVIDNTQLGYWAEYFYPSYCPGGLIAARGSSTIGFAFAGAIGVKIAYPEKPILALIGDGGFLYSAQELATCVRHKIRFPIIVVNDNAYGVIAYLQHTAYKVEYESRLTNPDFVALANSYGVRGSRVDSPARLAKELEKALASEDLWIIELAATFPEPAFGRY
jgi:thiamine pyrophosphate-dependent acetolactate synthase large subunit-like protein